MDIQKALLTKDNTTGTLTSNGMEPVVMVLGCLVLEYVWYDFVLKHLGSFCNITSLVAWVYKGNTFTSLTVGCLLTFLFIRK